MSIIYVMETQKSINQNELFYNCTECASEIEVLSINENECTIEFQCINNKHKKKMSIKQYINKMKNFNDNNINNDICNIHNLKYECYCLDCNIHLCKDCLKFRNHINHIKNSIIEIQPNNKELNIYEKLINNYENKIENLQRGKINKLKENKNKNDNLNLKEIDNKLENLSDIKRLNDIIYNTYINYNNNYYNSINIQNILINSKNNNEINNELNAEYENIIKIKQKNKIIYEYEEKIKNIKLEYENKINEIKNNHNIELQKLMNKNTINNKIIKEYENGRYEGELITKENKGKGIFIYKSGCKYEGEWKNFMKEGKGIYYYKNGDRYVGDFKNDKYEGRGIYYYNNGDRYEGEFKKGKKEGKGIYYFNNGDRIMGDYLNDEKIGKHVVLTIKGEIKAKIYN